jgi:hypothetical protein
LVIEHMTKTVSKLSRKASNLHKRAGLWALYIFFFVQP